MANLFASLFETVGQAMADIRHKLVEEGWFGRQVTDTTPGQGIEPPSQPQATGWDMPRPSFDEQWAVADPTKTMEPANDIHGPEFER